MQSQSKSSEFFGRNWQADAKINTEINNKKVPRRDKTSFRKENKTRGLKLPDIKNYKAVLTSTVWNCHVGQWYRIEFSNRP